MPPAGPATFGGEDGGAGEGSNVYKPSIPNTVETTAPSLPGQRGPRGEVSVAREALRAVSLHQKGNPLPLKKSVGFFPPKPSMGNSWPTANDFAAQPM